MGEQKKVYIHIYIYIYGLTLVNIIFGQYKKKKDKM